LDFHTKNVAPYSSFIIDSMEIIPFCHFHGQLPRIEWVPLMCWRKVPNKFYGIMALMYYCDCHVKTLHLHIIIILVFGLCNLRFKNPLQEWSFKKDMDWKKLKGKSLGELFLDEWNKVGLPRDGEPKYFEDLWLCWFPK